MNVIAIGTEKMFDSLARCLDIGLQELHQYSIEASTGRCEKGTQWYYTIESKNAQDHLKVRQTVAKCMADFLTDQWASDWFRKRIQTTYSYYDVDELVYLTKTAVQFLQSYRRPSSRLFRRAELEQELTIYLQEHAVLHIEGLIRFRLNEFITDLQKAMEYAIDRDLMDREYQEFVKLLRHFLQMQKSRSPLVHLVLTEEAIQLVDYDGMPITDEDLQRFSEGQPDDDLQQENMLISTLITLAPSHVKIHMPIEFSHFEIFSDMVKQVFRDRVLYCKGCSICQPVFEVPNLQEQPPLDYLT
ncbi:putative sporulation protein YtxC [Effusibacillus dendaii]|uniref:Sporulation protein YtxC n=1 Tax=Effusibacillus dendaii TaxID=2743772 RepID=A0A7I8DD17_9BACL|nr:putative sporulation protein YtxC [Effusibacillus dendaii]BCJ88088.1 hypothetical protein skT53_30730 [Effusibacillus dendaii]